MFATLTLSLLAVAPSPLEATARAFIEDVRTKNVKAFTPKLSAELAAALPGDALASAWAQVAEPLGAFRELELLHGFEKEGLEGFVFAARFERGAVQLTMALDPKSSKVAGFFLKPLGKEAPLAPAPPAPYVVPGSFGSFDVKVGRAPYELPGTLTMPKGEGPFPAVVLVHGSGPNDRDETIGANKPFKDLAEGLSSRGIAVLRYDKRTLTWGRQYVGKDIGLDEEVVDDAVSAVALLKDRAGIDPQRLYVVGHSLGALLAPTIALRAKSVAGVVLLAPGFRKPWDVVPQQLAYLGVPAEKVAEVERAFAEVKAGRATGPVFNAPAAYWRAWAAVDGPATARKFKGRVLVLRGARDYQVIDADFAGWKKGLAGLKSAELVELPGLNHLFIAGEGRSTPAEYQVPSHVAPVVLEQLTRFCR